MVRTFRPFQLCFKAKSRCITKSQFTIESTKQMPMIRFVLAIELTYTGVYVSSMVLVEVRHSIPVCKNVNDLCRLSLENVDCTNSVWQQRFMNEPGSTFLKYNDKTRGR